MNEPRVISNGRIHSVSLNEDETIGKITSIDGVEEVPVKIFWSEPRNYVHEPKLYHEETITLVQLEPGPQVPFVHVQPKHLTRKQRRNHR